MTETMEIDAACETARAVLHARSSYGRLVAYLAAQWRDIARAEDALSEALLRALETWPRSGVPDKPEAWLLQVARRKLLDGYRHERTQSPLDENEALLSADHCFETEEVPDKRLALMVLCAHPAIDESIRPVLMLQTVLGLPVQKIASAMLLSPATLAKRLTRAKHKIRDAGIRFEPPEKRALPERLHAVLEAIYAAYSLGADLTMTAGDENDELREEALFLAEVAASLASDSAEALGLYALLQFCEARRPAQFNAEGDFVPLLQQDTAQWSKACIQAGNEALAKATHLGAPGPFQTEAAIHAAHCSRLFTGHIPWSEIALLYEALLMQNATIGSEIGRAVAVTYARQSPLEGLAVLASLPEELTRNYQPWWLAKAHIAELNNSPVLALECICRAIGLSAKPLARQFLLKERHRLEQLS